MADIDRTGGMIDRTGGMMVVLFIVLAAIKFFG
jgi:hypothetical protein